MLLTRCRRPDIRDGQPLGLEGTFSHGSGIRRWRLSHRKVVVGPSLNSSGQIIGIAESISVAGKLDLKFYVGVAIIFVIVFSHPFLNRIRKTTLV